MRIITNADDFGMDADTTAATIDCFQAGALTSASIMPKMPATDLAVEFALKNPQFSFGVHLTFVCDTVESPISPREKLPALVGSDGRFLPSQTVRKLAGARLNDLSRRLANETVAQIGDRLGKALLHAHQAVLVLDR